MVYSTQRKISVWKQSKIHILGAKSSSSLEVQWLWKFFSVCRLIVIANNRHKMKSNNVPCKMIMWPWIVQSCDRRNWLVHQVMCSSDIHLSGQPLVTRFLSLSTCVCNIMRTTTLLYQFAARITNQNCVKNFGHIKVLYNFFLVVVVAVVLVLTLILLCIETKESSFVPANNQSADIQAFPSKTRCRRAFSSIAVKKYSVSVKLLWLEK